MQRITLSVFAIQRKKRSNTKRYNKKNGFQLNTRVRFLDLKKEIKGLQNQILECEKQKENLKEKVRNLEFSAVLSKNKKPATGEFNKKMLFNALFTY